MASGSMVVGVSVSRSRTGRRGLPPMIRTARFPKKTSPQRDFVLLQTSKNLLVAIAFLLTWKPAYGGARRSCLTQYQQTP